MVINREDTIELLYNILTLSSQPIRGLVMIDG